MTTRDAVSPEANHRLGSAITRPDQDRYGFVHVAHHLRLAIERLGRKGSAVIGIEGPWGSGKSSLLTLMETELRSKPEPRTFILKISPWLNGDSVSPVSSLLLPVAGIAVSGAVNVISLCVVSIKGPPAKINRNDGRKVNQVTIIAARAPPRKR